MFFFFFQAEDGIRDGHVTGVQTCALQILSVNIVIDGIFVGNGVGSIALASVNIAVPVFSVIISIALLIGMGGGTLYSIAMGRGEHVKAQKTFTLSMVFITVITVIIAGVSYLKD